MSNRWATVLSTLLTLLSTAAITIGLYVGLRLEPLYQKINRMENEYAQHEASSRSIVNDYIAFKAQTIEILRQQNAELADIKTETRRIRRSN